LEALGFDLAVTRMAQDLGRHNGFNMEIEIDVETDTFSKPASVVLFRIIQQALTNISRHAKAKSAAVTLAPSDGRVVMRISDDGVGFETEAAERKGRLGLMGIRERSLLLRGDCRIESSPGTGSVIEISFPLERLKNEVVS
jgi:signal transduction histidine kinase